MGSCGSRLRKRQELWRGTDLDKIWLVIGLYFQESAVLPIFFWLSFPYIELQLWGSYNFSNVDLLHSRLV